MITIVDIKTSNVTQRELTPEEIAALPTPSLSDTKTAKLHRIQAGKVAARDRGVEVNGVLFDSDLAARMAYLELAARLQQNPDFSTVWKASAGQWVTMDAALFAQVMAAGEAHIQACFAWQAAREMEVAAAQTAAEVEAVSEVM